MLFESESFSSDLSIAVSNCEDVLDVVTDAVITSVLLTNHSLSHTST